MAREFAKPFYNSSAWRRCRAAFIAERMGIDGGYCQRCGMELGYIVHHREWLTPENIGSPEITLNHSNLEFVCLTCHNRIDEEEDAPRCRFTPEGQVEAYPPFKEGGGGAPTTAHIHSLNTQGLCMTPSQSGEEEKEV